MSRVSIIAIACLLVAECAAQSISDSWTQKEIERSRSYSARYAADTDANARTQSAIILGCTIGGGLVLGGIATGLIVRYGLPRRSLSSPPSATAPRH